MSAIKEIHGKHGTHAQQARAFGFGLLWAGDASPPATFPMMFACRAVADHLQRQERIGVYIYSDKAN